MTASVPVAASTVQTADNCSQMMDMATWPVQQSASWAMALPPLALAAVISPHSGEDIISAVPADADTDTDTSGPVTPQMEQHSLHFFSQ